MTFLGPGVLYFPYLYAKGSYANENKVAEILKIIKEGQSSSKK